MKITMENSREISQLQKLIPERFKRALQQLLVATNPYSSQKEHEPTDTSIDCCICIGEIGPFQALFIAPCSHCFHFKCVQHFVRDTVMFPCPICRQVANLEASVSMESVIDWKQKSFHPSYASLDEVDNLSSMSPTPRTPFGLQMANLSTSDGGLPSPIAEGELHNDHDMLD